MVCVTAWLRWLRCVFSTLPFCLNAEALGAWEEEQTTSGEKWVSLYCIWRGATHTLLWTACSEQGTSAVVSQSVCGVGLLQQLILFYFIFCWKSDIGMFSLRFYTACLVAPMTYLKMPQTLHVQTWICDFPSNQTGPVPFISVSGTTIYPFLTPPFLPPQYPIHHQLMYALPFKYFFNQPTSFYFHCYHCCPNN